MTTSLLTKIFLPAALCLSFLPLAAPAAAAARSGDADGIEAAKAASAWQRAASRACGGDGCAVSGLERRRLAGDVFQYSLRLRVGLDERAVIRLHRVVKERRPFVPIRSRHGVLMAHGDAWTFEGAFLSSLASDAVPDRRALPIFLAANDVDVWGIDFRWTQVPAETEDLSFMAEWGTATDARDLGVALRVVRALRGLTGSGLGRVHLLGWSRGATTGYAYLNAESQLPPRRRSVKGFVPVDVYLKTDDEGLRQDACDRYDVLKADFDAGNVAAATGILFQQLGQLAQTAPDEPSTILPGLTNFQAALFLGTDTYALFPGGTPPVPVYHFAGGFDDENGLPAGLLYTPTELWPQYIQGTAPYQPARLPLEGDALFCDELDLPFDDHLEDVTVPVLYVGAGGGFGEFGIYTTTLLGSEDIETLVVSLRPPEEREMDIGHSDVFTAVDAPELFWRPFLRWLRSH